MPPTGLEVAAEADGIRLTWVPARGDTGDRGTIAGRRRLERGHRQALDHRRMVRSQRRPGTRLELPSAFGPPARTKNRGLSASRAPRSASLSGYLPAPGAADLVCLPEGNGCGSVGGHPDAETYRVYRGADGADPTVLADPVRATQFEDNAPPPGTSEYGVTAIDAADNESAPSTCTAARGSSP